MTNIKRIILVFLLIVVTTCARAAVSFVSDGGYGGGGGATATLSTPAGIAVGDAMVMCVGTATSGSQGTISTPAGWTLIGSTGAASDGGAPWYLNLYLFYRVANSTDAAGTTYGASYNTGGTLVSVEGNIRGYTGSAAAPINSSAFVLTSASNANNVVPALSETFVSGEMYFGCSASTHPDTVSFTSPVLSHISAPMPYAISLYMGDYVPGGVPGTETYNYGGGVQPGRVGWGASIKPLIGGGGSTCNQLPLLGAGC
jgi:hypothetical protein